MLRNKIFLLVITFSGFSCNPLKHINGKYCIIKNSVSPNNTILVLNSNNTFNGKSGSDIAGNFSVSGKWRTNGDTLFMDIKKPKLVDTIIYLPKAISTSALSVQIFDNEKKMPIEDVNIFCDNKIYTTDKKGSVNIDSILQGFLTFNYLGVKDTISSGQMKNMGVIKVFLNFSDLQTFSISEKWIIKRRKIIPIEKGYSAFKKCN